MQETDTFQLHIDLAITILKTQDLLVINTFKQGMFKAMEPEYAHCVAMGAMHRLAESDGDAFTWALHNYDPDFYLETRRHIVVWAAIQLIQQGLIPGQDFSALPGGGLAMRSQDRQRLTPSESAFLNLLLQEVLHLI